jgi:Na+/H+-dicarboxylate symporter
MAGASSRRQTALLLIALVAGVALGQYLFVSVGPAQVGTWWTAAGELLLLRPLQMIVVPLVVLSVISGIASIGEPARLGIVGGATVAFYVVTMLVAASIGALAVSVFQPGAGVPEGEVQAMLARGAEAYSADSARAQRMEAGRDMGLGGAWQSILGQILPRSPLQEAVQGNTVGVVTISILIGLGLAAAGSAAQSARDAVDGLLAALLAVIRWILWLMPFGLFFFMVGVIGKIGLLVAADAVGQYAFVVTGSLLVHAFLVLPLLGTILGGTNGWSFMWRVRRALLTAFSTSSSSATLPVTLATCTEEGGCSKRATRFVIPIGATLNMDGTALYEAVAALFLFQLFGVDLTFGDTVVVVVTATLAAIGAAGIPSAGLVTLVIVITAVNTSLAGRGVATIPIEAIGIIIGVDRLLDMARTTVNVWGDCVGAKVITRLAPDA